MNKTSFFIALLAGHRALASRAIITPPTSGSAQPARDRLRKAKAGNAAAPSNTPNP
jgi:hypothetical protein